MSDGYFHSDGKTFEPWAVAEGEPATVPLFEHGGSMDKVASSLDHVPSLQKFINKAKPEEGWYSLLIHAVGADEVWGGNRKADAFPLEWLVPADKTASYGYETFKSRGLGYVHHRNTPDKWTGKVLLAEYSRPMGRVELIVKFNIKRLIEEGAPYFAEMLEKGELPAVSMGCRVPYDICSICGNKAPTTLQYCDHLKNHRMSILEDGRRVRMWNYRPVFHDISLVRSPADRAARVLLKIAEDEMVYGKEATIRKRIGPFSPTAGLRVLKGGEIEAAVASEGDRNIPLKALKKAASLPHHTFLSNVTALGMLLRPHEYAAWELFREGNQQKAAEVYEAEAEFPIYESMKDGMYFHPAEDKMLDFVDLASTRSVFVPAFTKRASMYANKPERSTSGEDCVVPEHIHYKYADYRKSAEEALLSGKALEWTMKRPRILTQVTGDGINLVLKQASLDRPREVFESLVRGGYLTKTVKNL